MYVCIFTYVRMYVHYNKTAVYVRTYVRMYACTQQSDLVVMSSSDVQSQVTATHVHEEDMYDDTMYIRTYVCVCTVHVSYAE